MGNIPPVTKNLLIINVLCFVGMFVARRYGIDINDLAGLHFFLASDFNVAQLISYMFLHANFQHIFFNMFAVWMFGRVLEQVWGPKRFLTYYLICGIGAGLIQEVVQYIEYATVLSNYDSVQTPFGIIPMSEYLNQMTTVGASGAVYGIPTVKCLFSRFRCPLRPNTSFWGMRRWNWYWVSPVVTVSHTSLTWVVCCSV